MECHCGKKFKTINGFEKHVLNCHYSNMDIKKIYNLGLMIHDISPRFFSVSLQSIKKYSKTNQTDIATSKNNLIKDAILKYKKSLFDILNIFETELLVSEYREFIRFVLTTYDNISLISLKSMLTNKKIHYRFNCQNTFKTIATRIDSSKEFILDNNDHLVNEYSVVYNIINGNISIYYLLFNDYMAEQWFACIDEDLQHELAEYIEMSSKNIINVLTPKEFDILNSLANEVNLAQ